MFPFLARGVGVGVGGGGGGDGGADTDNCFVWGRGYM